MRALTVLALAQAQGGGSVVNAVVFIAVLLGVIVLAGFGLMRIRRGYFGPADGSGGDDASLSLDDLRQMRDRGELSEEEFARAAGVLAESAKRPK